MTVKRLLWLGVGLAIGGLVVRSVSRRAQSLTPGGIATAARDSGRNLFDSVRDFVDDVRDGMQQREEELHTAFAEGVELSEELERGLSEDFDDMYGEAADDPDTRLPVRGSVADTGR